MSTIPAAIAALVALAKSTLDGNVWQVIDGPANSVTTTRDHVLAVGDEEVLSLAAPDSYADASRAERYTVPLVVSVALSGPDSLAAARDEADAAHEAVYAAVLDDALGRNLGLEAQGVVEAIPTSERRVQQFATENGRSVAIRFGVDVYAQII